MSLQKSVYADFQLIHKIVSSSRFINMEGLSGEIPFWIAPYDIKADAQVDTEVVNLVKKLSNQGIKALCIDLFDLTCDIIEKHIGIQEMISLEKSLEKAYFKDALQSTINIHERFIPAIAALVKEKQPAMLFLKGVGKVYPFIRSHTVLNNLQSSIKHIPTLMFYPGEYSGRALKLFDLLEDDNYYRANNIFSQKR
ncbi:MAG TPA: DUF1788 domain-containing protein [Syntrophorhabdus sp.]|jgi:hypothetical protein|nr:DUF1788 domain-containing protein [Syntrophorhabdus sp.]HPW37584.1 DUF1788 domain-containing protein [Syntrophorhabdus sp.]